MSISAIGTVPSGHNPCDQQHHDGDQHSFEAFAAVVSEQLELQLGERHDVVRQFAHVLGDPVRRRGVDPLRRFIVVLPTIQVRFRRRVPPPGRNLAVGRQTAR